MKKLTCLFIFVIIFSITSWSLTSMIVNLGTEVIENNSFGFAQRSFQRYGMPLEPFPEGKYGYAVDKIRLLVTLDLNKNNTIKEVTFLWGLAYEHLFNFDIALTNAGYSLVTNEKIVLNNKNTIPQAVYSNGYVICLVQTIDDGTKRLIFKHYTN